MIVVPTEAEHEGGEEGGGVNTKRTKVEVATKRARPA